MIKLTELIYGTSEKKIALYTLIVNRLNILHEQLTRNSMAKFRRGDLVAFRTGDGKVVIGVIVHLNNTTVTVRTKSDERWNITPQLLTKAEYKPGAY